MSPPFFTVLSRGLLDVNARFVMYRMEKIDARSTTIKLFGNVKLKKFATIVSFINLIASEIYRALFNSKHTLRKCPYVELKKKTPINS